MNVRLQILIIAFILIKSNILIGQEIEFPKTEIKVEVGEKKVIFYNVINQDEFIGDVSVRILLPEYFRMLTHSQPKEFEANAKKQSFFALMISSNTPFGKYPIKLELYVEGDLIKEASFLINVARNRKLEIVPLEKPDFITESESFELAYILKNTGNSEESILLSSRSGQIIGVSELKLKAGESERVRVLTLLPDFNEEYKYISLDLRANLEEESIPFSSVITVPLLSYGQKKRDPYQRFPIVASLMYNHYTSTNEKVGAVQFDFEGNGFVDANEEHGIHFIARGPDRPDLPRFGNISQYFLGYNYKGWEVNVGDKLYAVSNLIENYRFSRGLEIVKKFGDKKASAFYMKPRYFSSINHEFGFTFEQKVNEKLDIKAIVLHKDHEIINENKKTSFLGLNAQINSEKFWLNTEGGLSLTNNQISGALYNSGFLDLNKFNIYSNFILTGKTYYGLYNNSILFNNSLNYLLSKKIRIGLSQNFNQINPSLDSYLYTTAPFYQNINVNFNYRFNRKNRVQLSFLAGGREDKLEVQSYHYKERFIRYLYGLQIGYFDLRFDGDFGKTLNLLPDFEDNGYDKLFRNRFALNYIGIKHLSLGGFFEYLNTTKFELSEETNEFLFYGFDANYQFKNWMDLSLNFRNNYTPDELFRNQSFLDADLNFQFQEHQIGLIFSYGFIPDPVNEKNIFASIKYTISLNAPLRKKKGLGSLFGKLSGQKSEGVVLKMNSQSLITNFEGAYEFNDLVPGNYNMSVTKSSLGFGNMIKTPFPVRINIAHNEQKEMNFEVVRTGKVIGEIIIEDSQVASKIRNVLIEINKDDFSKITSTNDLGEFQFSELLKGHYSIRIISGDIQKKYQIMNNNSFFDIIEGEESTYNFKLKIKKRIINFQKETIILSD